MSEISESALDALMTSLQTLKMVRISLRALLVQLHSKSALMFFQTVQKLAETREQRELGRDADKLYLEHRLPTDESSNGPPSFGRGPRLV